MLFCNKSSNPLRSPQHLLWSQTMQGITPILQYRHICWPCTNLSPHSITWKPCWSKISPTQFGHACSMIFHNHMQQYCIMLLSQMSIIFCLGMPWNYEQLFMLLCSSDVAHMKRGYRTWPHVCTTWFASSVVVSFRSSLVGFWGFHRSLHALVPFWKCFVTCLLYLV